MREPSSCFSIRNGAEVVVEVRRFAGQVCDNSAGSRPRSFEHPFVLYDLVSWAAVDTLEVGHFRLARLCILFQMLSRRG